MCYYLKGGWQHPGMAEAFGDGGRERERERVGVEVWSDSGRRRSSPVPKRTQHVYSPGRCSRVRH